MIPVTKALFVIHGALSVPTGGVKKIPDHCLSWRLRRCQKGITPHRERG
jgi:hypothetical protein